MTTTSSRRVRLGAAAPLVVAATTILLLLGRHRCASGFAVVTPGAFAVGGGGVAKTAVAARIPHQQRVQLFPPRNCRFVGKDESNRHLVAPLGMVSLSGGGGSNSDQQQQQQQRRSSSGNGGVNVEAGGNQAGRTGGNAISSSSSNLSAPRSPSPATVFGTPIGDDMKKANRELIRAAKSWLFDVVFAGESVERAYARFYALETIARMPYFSYLSVLHLYETLGRWRKAEYLRVHFAETWNELHHLLIMEELLGEDLKFVDRFVAQHVAFFYYWIVIGLYMVNPTQAYNLNQCVEEEAYGTYDKFLKANGDYLKGQPAPSAAVEYYTSDDLYLFDSMHTPGGSVFGSGSSEQQHPSSSSVDAEGAQPRRPVCETLYDTFANIRDDEWEHVKTMAYLQEEENQQRDTVATQPGRS